jgi:hypothetical protein
LRKSFKNNLFRKRFLIYTSNSPNSACYEKAFSEVSIYEKILGEDFLGRAAQDIPPASRRIFRKSVPQKP